MLSISKKYIKIVFYFLLDVRAAFVMEEKNKNLDLGLYQT